MLLRKSILIKLLPIVAGGFCFCEIEISPSGGSFILKEGLFSLNGDRLPPETGREFDLPLA